MDLLVFFIMFVFCGLIFFMINYYRKLFTDGRAEYTKDELLSIKEILLQEWQDFSGDNAGFSYVTFAIGTFAGLIFSYMGGVTGNNSESYFFHSALLPGLWFLALPYLREQFEVSIKNQTIWGKIIENDIPFLIGFCVSTMAQNFAIYGLYHKLSFLWIILNNSAIIVLLIYRFHQLEKSPEYLAESYQSEEQANEEE